MLLGSEALLHIVGATAATTGRLYAAQSKKKKTRSMLGYDSPGGATRRGEKWLSSLAAKV